MRDEGRLEGIEWKDYYEFYATHDVVIESVDDMNEHEAYGLGPMNWPGPDPWHQHDMVAAEQRALEHALSASLGGRDLGNPNDQELLSKHYMFRAAVGGAHSKSDLIPFDPKQLPSKSYVLAHRPTREALSQGPAVGGASDLVHLDIPQFVECVHPLSTGSICCHCVQFRVLAPA